MIAIIDYGMGNVGSIANMLKKIGKEAIVTSDPGRINEATKLILPGVGAFDYGMENLMSRGFVKLLNEKVLAQKTPILGICLGMQLFSKRSEEGQLDGLGWIRATTERFQFPSHTNAPKVPHMGWNTISLMKESVLFDDMYPEPRFYFVHSYYVRCQDDDDVLSMTTHGCRFASALEKGNIAGVQFHPEKSHKFGMKILQNFADKFNNA